MSLRLNFVSHRLLAWLAPVWFVATMCDPGAAVAAGNGMSGPRSGLWAHETSALKPDPAVTFGRLGNGLRYALLPHRGVPGRVSLRFMVLTGSLDETNEELGIAHYLEHLAFRKTRDFTTEQQVEFFQQLGMDPNSDINARTSHEQTVYMIECREAKPELLEQALLWMRNVADGVAFDPEEIDEERGVILSELRVGDDLLRRSFEASYPVLLKGLRYPQRFPIGTQACIRSFQRSHFLAFYQRNYRSDQMIVVATGDFDAVSLAAMVQKQFGSMVKPPTAATMRDEGRLDVSKVLRADVFKVTDVGSAVGIVGHATPMPTHTDSRESHLEALRREFAFAVFSMRVAKEAEGGANFRMINGHATASAMAPMDPNDWPRGLGVLDDLVRFTHQKGFEQREIDMLKRRYETRTQFQLEQKDLMDPGGLAEGLVEAIENHHVYVGFEPELQWEKEWLKKLTVREINLAFQSSWDLERMSFFVGGDVDIEGGATEVLKKVHEARRGGLRSFRPDTRKEAVFKLPTWGTPTEVVESKSVPEFGARLMRFGNNVRLNFISTRSDPGVVNVLARFGTGVVDMPVDRPALKEVALQTLISSGTTHFTTEQLAAIIQDHLFDITLDLDENDAFAFRASAAPEKIDVPLAIIADTLHRPVFGTFTHREEKIKAVVARILGGTGMSDGERQLEDHLFRGDPRFTSVSDPKYYLGLSAVDVKDWLQEPLTRGYLEVTVVGDIAEEAVVRAMSRTLGSLPPRAMTKMLLTPPTPIKMAAPPGFQRIEFVGEQHLGQAAGVWPIQEKITIRDHAALLILSKVLEQHVFREVRNRLGLAYTPGVGLQRFSGFQSFALMRASVECDPAETSRVAVLLEDIAAHLAEGGMTKTEFTGARGVLSGRLRSLAHESSFLLNLLRRAQENPESLENGIRLQEGLIDNITFEEVDAWAKKILPRKNSRTAAIVPKQFIGIFQTGR